MLLIGLCLSGCASVRSDLPTPILVVGVVEQPKWTGWVFNHCEYGQPVLMEDRLCLAHGGELHDSVLTRPRVVGGSTLGAALRIAYPGHGYASHYRARRYMILQPSTAEFQRATGINYIATEMNNYDEKERCLRVSNFGHVDFRYCPEPAFHDRHRDDCLPVDQYLAHFATPAKPAEAD